MDYIKITKDTIADHIKHQKKHPARGETDNAGAPAAPAAGNKQEKNKIRFVVKTNNKKG